MAGAFALAAGACSANKDGNSVFGSGGGVGVGTAGTAGAGATRSSGGSGAGLAPGNAGSGGAGIKIGGDGGSCATTEPDADGDGWTTEQGDCNDCDKLVNPGAIDVINYEKDAEGNPTETVSATQVDEDCDGTPKITVTACDQDLPAVISDPLDAAKAMGICNVGVEENPSDPRQRKWGVIAASFSDIAGAFLTTPPRKNASPAKQLSILPDFGSATQPQEGASLFALSSGNAKIAKNFCKSDSAFANNQYPPGFPKKGDCGTTGNPFDGIALDMKLRAPTNAKSFKIRFKFFTCEYPDYTCSLFNDVFAILMAPSPLLKNDPMSDGGNNTSANIAFETSDTGTKNVIGVNNTSFLTACKPDPQTEKYKNCGNDAGLKGSGFEGHAASAWLETQVPIPAFPEGADRVISLRFAIWDSADHKLDSTAVVDGFEWSADEGSGVGTVIVPVPK